MFSLTFAPDNDAFHEPNGISEVQEILEWLARQLDGKVIDSDGNTIGTYKLSLPETVQ
ncbi:hypothetical protein [Motilibacter deserti]|uniref:Uncharacterized protein n=1 Tax=Motilibacter deserti TaxID=2714956 RepID=A0ABX0GRP2_9ACTN|nr:hypothetical protein [Motilibacter deserti]NHC12519.1 hypothetical protein [Motilibacter deserti]